MKLCARMVAGIVCLVGLLLLPASARAQTPPLPDGCTLAPMPFGALGLVCVPPTRWNGQLVVFAQGYTPPQVAPGFHQLATADGTLLPALVMSRGFAFATTTYRDSGLVVLEGMDDIRALVAAVTARIQPSRTHITGVSYGALVATLLAEQSPELFRSALAACGPIGSFRQQINYLGDFRVLFDYFFPGVLPGNAVVIDPPVTFAEWNAVHVPGIAAALSANPPRALELMRVSRVAYDPTNLATVIRSATAVLAYNVLGINDANAKLGGNPYGNRVRWYFGSSNDFRLNLLVQRYSADPAALAAMAPYETDGDLRIPLVTIHTTADEVAPFAHELLYLPKLDLAGRGRFVPFPVPRYGHCNFTPTEIGLSLLYAVNLP